MNWMKRLENALKTKWPKEESLITSDGYRLSAYLQPIDPDEHLLQMKAEIERLQIAWSDEKTWEALIVPALRNLSKVVQRLPVTADGVFSEPDGMFLASIKSATYAVEVMEGTVQLERNIMAQELLQTRLKGAALLAALCSFVKVLVNEMEIKRPSMKTHPFFEMDEAHFVENLPFNPLAQTYYEWVKEALKKDQDLELCLNWREARYRLVNAKRTNLQLFVSRLILPSPTLAWLGNAGYAPLLELMRALSATESADFDPSSVIYARDLGVYRACQLERERLGAKLGRVLKPYGWQETLIRCLRARVWQDWTINAKESPLRRGGDGLFLFWPDVCDVLVKDLKDQGLNDLPDDPNLWAGLLLDAGITLPSRRGTATAMIAVTPNAKPREAVKLADEKFFTVGQIDPKKTKRAFECEDLSLAQEVGLSRLTREVIEHSQKAFESHIPQVVEKPSMIDWRLEIDCQLKETQEKLLAFTALLSRLGEEVGDFIVDEGILLPSDLLEREEQIGTPSLFIANLESEGYLHRNEAGSVLFAKYPKENGDIETAPILLPSILSIRFKGNGTQEKVDFDRLFSYLKGRKRQSSKAKEEAFQLDLFKGENV